MSDSNLHIAWAQLLVRHLMQAGVTHAVVSPGSRSTPLVLALAQEQGIRTDVVIDERSAAFVALGHARATGKPSMLLCTSGSAAAHYFPAIVEASLGRVPLVVLTADRPWDAYDCGAPQTIDQCKMYGDYVRHYAELGLPDEAAFLAVVRLAHQSVSLSLGPDPGPVHINARFRKPLEPQPVGAPEPWRAQWEAALLSRPRAVVDSQQPSLNQLDHVADRMIAEKNGLIVCGPSLGSPLSAEAVQSLADTVGYPVLCEASSGVRFASHELEGSEKSPFVYSIEALLSSRWFAENQPKVLIELGLPIVSTRYSRWVAEQFKGERVVIAAHGYQDPIGTASLHWNTDPNRTLTLLKQHIDEIQQQDQRTPAGPGTGTIAQWKAADARAQSAAADEVRSAEKTLTEGATAALVRASLIEHSVLVIGNSAVLRDVDAYAFGGPAPVNVIHQRGASGIDGLISLSVGARSAQKKHPVVLVIGDVSTWHDVGALQLGAAIDRTLVVVIVQNHGGRIFDRLPLAKSTDANTQASYERFFLTDQKREFGDICKGFSIQYERCTSASELAAALHKAMRTQRMTVVEAICAPGGADRFAAVVRAGALAVDTVLGSHR